MPVARPAIPAPEMRARMWSASHATRIELKLYETPGVFLQRTVEDHAGGGDVLDSVAHRLVHRELLVAGPSGPGATDELAQLDRTLGVHPLQLVGARRIRQERGARLDAEDVCIHHVRSQLGTLSRRTDRGHVR